MYCMRIAILGFGSEGKSTLAYLKQASEFRKAEIVVLDQRLDPAYLKSLASFDLIIKTPGIPYMFPEIKKALKAGVKFTSATEIFFEKAKGTVIGITGTKGKGTTATLLYRILKTSGLDAHLAGNIGRPMLDVLPKLVKKSFTVLELSSFQLQHLKYSPSIAVVLEIVPDHLDAHASFKEYVEAKSNIAKHQKRSDKILFIKGSKYSELIAKKSAGKIIPIDASKFDLFTDRDMRIPGRHNFLNAVVAASIAEHLGVKADTIKKAVRSFRGLPLRLEQVSSAGGISFYNDSASTNPHSSIAAINAFSDSVVLIAGGKDKGFGYEPLAQALRDSSVKLVILFGENKGKIYAALKDCRRPVEMAPTLDFAVRRSLSYVKKMKSQDEQWSVVFSPGAASFDMFKDYKERGQAFNEIVGKLRI